MYRIEIHCQVTLHNYQVQTTGIIMLKLRHTHRSSCAENARASLGVKPLKIEDARAACMHTLNVIVKRHLPSNSVILQQRNI